MKESPPTRGEIAAYASAMGCSEEWAKHDLSMVHGTLRERVIRAAVSQRRSEGELLHDPIEDEPEIAALVAKAEAEATASCSEEEREQMGSCHILWQRQAEILQRRFGVVWFSPADMNPGTFID